ncbi:MAG TPA: ABC transporter ATP-binding protein [Gemmatimonadaceae bacterium]|nr:ABC transporter ATP-binding protein [Gemmatimonadaceae bacterium]
MSEPSGLRLDGLSRRYEGSGRGVESLSLDVRPGELLALIGASGSGKTTTLRMIAGYEAPDAGRIALVGATGTERDITREKPQRRGFGMVFQHYALFPHMSVQENVAFGLEARRMPKAERLAQAAEALASVGLAGYATRSVQVLSGGEQQRVALARALVIEPNVLLLDEPLSNLDPTLRQATRDELREMLHRLHITVVFVTHDQEDAFAVADRVAMLCAGRLEQVGTPEDLYQAPASAVVARFVGRGALVPAHAEGDAAVVTIGAVQQRGPLGSAPDARGRAQLAVLRPESLTVVDAADAESWRGIVHTRRFAGDHYVYRVGDIAGTDDMLEVRCEHGRHAEGDAVGVRLRSRPIALVAAAGAP